MTGSETLGVTIGDEGADLSNWRASPFSRWAFHYVDKVLPVAAIAAGPQAMALPDALQPLDERVRLSVGGRSLDLAAVLQATATDGIVVLQDGRVVYERYFNGMTQESPHILMSATKSVVGLIAGILQGQGALDVDALVSRYVPEIEGTAYAEATVRHLLDMRTGVVLDGEVLGAYTAASHWDPVAEEAARPSFHEFFSTMAAPHRPHGGAFSYISANTDLLGWVLERAAGEPFAALASRLLWAPMGAERGALITTDRAGSPRCTGGLCATVRDFARLGQLMVQQGQRDGAAVVPLGWVEDIGANGDREAWRTGEFGERFAPLSRSMSYRSGWYVVDGPPRMLFATGIHGQNLFVDEASRLVVAKVSSQADRVDERATGLTHMAVAAIRRCLTG